MLSGRSVKEVWDVSEAGNQSVRVQRSIEKFCWQKLSTNINENVFLVAGVYTIKISSPRQCV
jgi:hypothetical protein